MYAAKFDFNGFREIQWDENAFDQLVLDSSHKRLLLAFTKQDDKEERKFDDFVSSKGRETKTANPLSKLI